MASVYVPNGRVVDSEFYVAKLAWLDRLRQHLVAGCDPSPPLVVCGDFNVAPDDRDVWDPTKLHGNTHVSPPERAAVAALLDWGLVDVFRRRYQEDHLYSWWDYRAGDFHQGRGLRIDLILATQVLAERADVGPHRPLRPQGQGPVRPRPVAGRLRLTAGVHGTKGRQRRARPDRTVESGRPARS